MGTTNRPIYTQDINLMSMHLILLHADYIANRLHENNYKEIMYSFALLTKPRIETNFLKREVALWLGQ